MKRYFYVIVALAVLSLVAASCVPFISIGGENEAPVAYIDSISPAEAEEGELITLQGHGTDADGTVVAYRWSSNIDGDIGTTATYQSSSLSEGAHIISFMVQDNNGEWSEAVNEILNIGTPAPTTEPDLVITDIYKVEVPEGYVVGYTIENQGDGNAEATMSALYANGDLMDTEDVPPLAAGDSLDREFEGWVFDPTMPEIMVVADRDDDIAESDEDNNEEEASLLEVVFDFVDDAENASWNGGPPQQHIDFGDDGAEGFVRYITGQLEDGSGPIEVMETHPKWIDDGWVAGTYIQVYQSGYIVHPGDHFFARVGFLQGAAAGNVIYRVLIRSEIDGNDWIVTQAKDYGTPLKVIDVPLGDYAGQQADFILRVEANGSSAQDWATWIEAKIIR